MPVVVVTGFLGAGKTTLIKALLETEEGRGTAVVVNEFGEIGIDGALLAPQAPGAVALLGNGCLCCGVRGDLERSFRTLFAERTRGAVPPFRRVVLETSGADDPGPLLQTFLSERALGREYHLHSVVAVVDLVTGVAALESSPEARRQVALSDRIVLTKADLAPPGALEALEERLRALNPHAPVRDVGRGSAPAEFVLEEPALRPPSSLMAEAVAQDGAAGRHTPELLTFAAVFDEPFEWRTLSGAFALLCDLRGRDLLRAKGLAAVDGCRGPVVVQAVQHVLHPPVELEAWPEPGDRRSRLVFITRGGLGRQAVLGLFQAAAELARRAPG